MILLLLDHALIDTTLNLFIRLVFLGIYTFLFTNFRIPNIKWEIAYIITYSILVLTNCILVVYTEIEKYDFSFMFTLTLPLLVLCTIISKVNKYQYTFYISNVFFANCFITLVCTISEALLKEYNLSWIISFIILFVFTIPVKYLKDVTIKIFQYLQKDWFWITLIPLFLSAILILFGSYVEKYDVILLLICISLILLSVVFYYVLYLFFKKAWDQNEAMHNNDILYSQVLSMENSIKSQDEVRESLRVERHNLRHQLRLIHQLLIDNKNKEAIDYITNYDTTTSYNQVEYCKNSIINALCTNYIKKANELGITVNARLDVPKNISVDIIEFTTVIANALENAIIACDKMTSGNKEITLRCVTSPRIMFEIKNTYNGNAIFGDDGYPITYDINHGIGTKTIKAFVEKHKGYCNYEAKDGYFSLRIAI